MTPTSAEDKNMNNSNPFHSPVSLLEQKNKKRARVKVAVFSIFAFNILLISPLLIQGCKEKQPPAATDNSTAPTNDVAADTNAAPALPTPSTNAVAPAPVAQAPVAPVVEPAIPAPAAADYVVVKGDTYSKIAHEHGTTVKALTAANPGVDPAKLQIGKKLQIPAATTATATAAPGASADSGETYVVKSGDSLFKIAHEHSITVKALRAANDLKTDKIKVGQKLKLPSSTTAAAAPAAAPVEATPPAPTSAVSVPAPAPGSGH